MIYLTHYRTSYSREIKLVEDTAVKTYVHCFPDLYEKLENGLSFIPHMLADKVLDEDLIKRLKETPVGKTAFIFAGGNLAIISCDKVRLYDNKVKYSYKIPSLTLGQIYAARVAQRFNAQDLVLSDSSACSSSLKILTDVQNLINHEQFDRVIVLSAEDGISNFMVEFLSSNSICLTYDQEEHLKVKPSAFDDRNFGFRISQGSVLAVFESERAIDKQSGISPKAILIGAGVGSEKSFNAIGQNEDGEGFKNAIYAALNASGMKADDIGIVKTHGTGTASNNKSEANALLDTLNNFVATSYKPKIGHTLGVSGLLETCMLLDDITKSNIIPPIMNRTKNDDIFLSKAIEPPNRHILSLAAGMGNIYSAAIFKPCRI